MARPPLPLGSWGTITTEKVRSGVYRSLTRYRDADGHTRRVSATGSSKAAAERALREILADRATSAGELIISETRLSVLAMVWLERLESEGRIEATTLNEYRRVLDKLVLPALGGLRLREVTTGRLDRFLVKLREQSINRQRKAEVVLGSLFDLAVRHDAIPINPARNTSRDHRPKHETRALRVEDLAQIRAAVRGWMNQDRPGPKPTQDTADIVDLLLATGCRIGEILALRWSDVDLDPERPTLTVSGTIKSEPGKSTYRKPTPKSHASVRTVVLPAFAAELLRRRAEAPPNALDAVFATRTGTWHQVENIERRWRTIHQDTGFDWVTPHTFRKTVATLLSEQAGDEQASRQLGHSSSQITRDFYIAKPTVAADLAHVLQTLAGDPDEPKRSRGVNQTSPRPALTPNAVATRPRFKLPAPGAHPGIAWPG